VSGINLPKTVKQGTGFCSGITRNVAPVAIAGGFFFFKKKGGGGGGGGGGGPPKGAMTTSRNAPAADCSTVALKGKSLKAQGRKAIYEEDLEALVPRSRRFGDANPTAHRWILAGLCFRWQKPVWPSRSAFGGWVKNIIGASGRPKPRLGIIRGCEKTL